MKKLTQMNKAELIEILVSEFGYKEEDIKTITNAKLVEMIRQEREDAKELEINENRIIVKDGTGLKDEDRIRVMSGSMGTVIYRSDISRRLWKFTRFGQIESIPYIELQTINNRYPRYYRDGLFVVLDKSVQDEFKLTEMYKNILTPDNIDTIFEKDVKDIEVFIKNLPEGMKKAFVDKAMELYQEEKLYDSRIIKLVEREFGFSLEDNTPVNDIALEGNLGSQNIIYVDKR